MAPRRPAPRLARSRRGGQRAARVARPHGGGERHGSLGEVTSFPSDMLQLLVSPRWISSRLPSGTHSRRSGGAGAAGTVRGRPLARRQDGRAPRRPPLAPSTSAAWLGRALGFVAAAQRRLVPSASERPPTSTSVWRTPRSCSTPSPASEAAAATRRHVVAVFLGCEAWSGDVAPRSSSAAPTFASVRGLSWRQPSRPRWLRLCSSSRRPCWRQRHRAGLPPPRREPQAEVARPALLQVRLSLPSRLSALFLGRVEPHLGALVH